MVDKEQSKEKKCGKNWNCGGEAVYGLGFLGAVIYFIQHATSLGMGLMGIIKAIFWPALVVYKILELFKF